MKISTFKSLFSRFWPIIILFLINASLFVINFKPRTYLTGWDNLHPEFSLGVNIQRSIFAVWQEYQSLGLLGGMGHASDLPRQIYLLLLSLFLPQNTLRYFSTFTMLFLGGFMLVMFRRDIRANDQTQKDALVKATKVNG